MYKQSYDRLSIDIWSVATNNNQPLAFYRIVLHFGKFLRIFL